MNRRLFLVATIGLPFAVHSQPAAALAALDLLIKIFGEAGKALSDFSKGIKDAVSNSLDVMSLVSVERELERLRKISKGMAIVIETKQQVVVRSIDEYLRLALQNPKPPASLMQAEWQGMVVRMWSVLSTVLRLLEDVKAENGNLVFEDVYANLARTLNNRADLLDALASTPAPIKDEELEALKIANDAYKQLLKNAKDALNELNKYAKSKRKS